MNTSSIDTLLSKLPPDMASQNAQSWLQVVASYARISQNPLWNFLAPMQELVETIAKSEQSQLFRAGKSLHILMISTADKHGLEDGQPFVAVRLERGAPWQIEKGFSHRGIFDQHSVGMGEDILTALQPFLIWLWDSTRGSSDS